MKTIYKKNNSKNKYSQFAKYLNIKLIQSITIIVLLCFLTSPSFSQPLQLGQCVVTSYDPGSPNVVRVIDIRNQPPFAIGGNYWNAPPQYIGADWTKSRMGSVYGIALDDAPSPNIFISSSTSLYFPCDLLEPDVTALIYKIDGNTWGVSDYVFRDFNPGPPQIGTNRMPNTGPGLGNLCFDKFHHQIFATNLEDGKIYRIGAGGIVLSIFDPFSADDNSIGFPPVGERLFGIGAYGTNSSNVRIYFCRWNSDRINQGIKNEIYSISLNNAGEFLIATLKPEIALDFVSGLYSGPVADIEFSFNGNMLLGERSMDGDCSSAHFGRMLEYKRELNGDYITAIEHKVGEVGNNRNSCGGVDFSYGISDSVNNVYSLCDSLTVGTGDYLLLSQVYGVQITERSKGPLNNFLDFSHMIDLDGDIIYQDKRRSGDIDVYRKDFCTPSYCDSLNATPLSIANNSNGNCCWQINLTHPADMSGISKVQFLTTGTSTFSSFNLVSPYNTWLRYSNSPTNQTAGPSNGNVPGGALTHFAEFCLSNSLTSSQKVIVKWLSSNDSVVCDDTLNLYCELPCMNITSDTVQCVSDSSYSVKFNFSNNANFSMKKLELTPLTPLGTVITPSTITLNSSVPPGGSANNVTFNISNVTAPSHVCILVKAISADNCCWCFDTICVDVPVCVCENLGYQLIPHTTVGGCDYTLNLINNFNSNYFTGVQTELITSGVQFGFQTAGAGWAFYGTSLNTTWLPVPVGTKIPNAANGKINFTLTGYTTTPQKIVLRWMRGIDRDTVVCTDTLLLNCVPPYPVTDTCSQFISVTTRCITGGFEFKFKIQNNSNFNATGFMIEKISPAGAVFSPANFSSVPINQNSISPVQTMNITGVGQGQRVCFKISLYKQIGPDLNALCCHSDTLCINMPYCQFQGGGDTLSVFVRPEALYPFLDTFKLELRGVTSPYPVADSVSVFSQMSGQKYKLKAVFNYADSGSSYYIVVKHRNSIETWSANPVYFNGDSLTYDFTTSQSKAFGNNMKLVGNLWAIFSGDVNQDGYSDLPDASLIDNDAYNFVSGYVNTDLDGNGLVDLSDILIVDNNSFNYVSVMKP